MDSRRVALGLFLALIVCSVYGLAAGRMADAKSIREKTGTLRSIESDAERGAVTKALALEIRQLPENEQLQLASGLANLTTEGDLGFDTVQTVADTLAGVLRKTPIIAKGSEIPFAYTQLAQFARYEGAKVDLKDPNFDAAMGKLKALETARSSVEFSLKDLDGKTWTMSELKGKVVLVNFWATWCPPCRKEMPDMQKLYERFKNKGLVILAISDEEDAKVRPFIAEHKYTFPVLLDPGRKVNEKFQMGGIPNSFVYGRDGKLAAQAIDGRSERQMLLLLAKAGLK